MPFSGRDKPLHYNFSVDFKFIDKLKPPVLKAPEVKCLSDRSICICQSGFITISPSSIVAFECGVMLFTWNMQELIRSVTPG